MKFELYFEETQTPEWKRAYLDYRALKDCISGIQHVQSALQGEEVAPLLAVRTEAKDVEDEEAAMPLPHYPAPRSPFTGASEPLLSPVRYSPPRSPLRDQPLLSPTISRPDSPEPSADNTTLSSTERSPSAEYGALNSHDVPPPSAPPRTLTIASTSSNTQGDEARPTQLNRFRTVLGRAMTFRRRNVRRKTTQQGQQQEHEREALADVLARMPPLHRDFFEKVDEELAKVEKFYCEREKEMRQRCNMLKRQLQELKDHRRAFYSRQSGLWSVLPQASSPSFLSRFSTGHEPADHKKMDSSSTLIEGPYSRDSWRDSRLLRLRSDTVWSGVENFDVDDSDQREPARSSMSSRIQSMFQLLPGQKKGDTEDASEREASSKHDPDEYKHAKRKLKKAVLEVYRGIELLNGYRTLNLTGFQKVLKKYEKVTDIPAQAPYTREKIEPCAFASGKKIQAMSRDLEELFAARFARGDHKKALMRLRSGYRQTTHHFSTFRTGLAFGITIPTAIGGLYESFLQETRDAIPGWGALLYVYAILFVPLLLAILIGADMLLWTRAHINYVFIFGQDVRTRLDHRVYFEIPAFLLSMLSVAFWLSFYPFSWDWVAPTTWPLIWMAITVAFMCNPLPIFFRPSRWWLFRTIGRLMSAGTRRVEFADFWIGDQLSSLIFSISGLFFVTCVYVKGFDEDWRKHCTTRPGINWGIPFVLASIPLIARIVQSVKRWSDSGLTSHLVNGGKYGLAVVNYLVYYLWKQSGGVHDTPFYWVWITVATSYSVYTIYWDLWMDWSVLKPSAPYPLLRDELLYDFIPFYYFAIVSDVALRFAWLLYVPKAGPDFIVRTFITAVLEVYRRWQWNVFRLENEHLGNVDQYRVTREVPLPYSLDAAKESDGEDEDDEDSVQRKRSRKTTVRRWGRGGSRSHSAVDVPPV